MFPVFSVVDTTPDGTVVVWRVLSAPDAGPDALSGAWVLGAGGVDSAKFEDIVAGSVLFATPRAQLGVDKHPGHTLESLAAAMEAEVKQYKAAAKEAKKANAQLTLPRFEAIQIPDVAEFEASYHGDPVGVVAWSYASALLGLVGQWNAIESQRKTRKYLHETFGAEVRSVPLGG